MTKEKTEVAGFPDGVGGFRVLCTECATVHRHAGGTADRGGHCLYQFDDFTNDDAVSRSITYSIKIVKMEMPAEMIEISKRAGKLWERLAWRKHRGSLYDKDWKKSLKDLQELRGLADRAKKMNQEILRDIF